MRERTADSHQFLPRRRIARRQSERLVPFGDGFTKPAAVLEGDMVMPRLKRVNGCAGRSAISRCRMRKSRSRFFAWARAL
jgi:hypothetical protein